MKLHNLKLSTKFTLAIGLILFIFCTVFSFLLYVHLKNKVIEDANEKTLIIMTQIASVGDYIRNTLRPKMFEILAAGMRDEFIVEAMSSTHVTQEVMRRFNSDLKDYVYRRVSDNPLNEMNRADQLHREIIGAFRQNRQRESWNRIMKIDGREYIIRARAIVADKGCLRCHGDPSQAPGGLLKKYGTDGGFGWTEGEIVGVESVTIPLAVALGQIKGIAISTFLFGSITLFFLFVSLQGAFWSLVSRPLNRLTTIFKGIVKGTEPLNQDLPITTCDEIGELTSSFNQMAKHLYHAQEDLKKNAETLHSIFEGISDPLALVNPDCSLEITNRTYREWIAKGISAVFTRECVSEDCEHDTLCPVCFLKKVKREKRAISEYWEGDDRRYYHVHFYPIFDGNGNVVKAVHYVKDITDRKDIEEQLRITEKLATVGQLSAGIAHEINNPLGGIKLCFNNLMNTAMDGSTREQHIGVIASGFDRIQNIVKQLLDFSKNSPLSISSTSINGIVENVLKLVEYTISEKGIELVKDLSGGMPDLMVDVNKIEQVFLNLVMNAVQVMEGKGILTVRTWCEGNDCNVAVSDTGKGIPSEIMTKIFDPFFSTKGVGEGTGLGLTVSKAIVEQHEGEIDVETSERGTTFTVRLPVAS